MGTHRFRSTLCSALDLVSFPLGRTSVLGLELGTRLPFVVKSHHYHKSTFQGSLLSDGRWTTTDGTKMLNNFDSIGHDFGVKLNLWGVHPKK